MKRIYFQSRIGVLLVGMGVICSCDSTSNFVSSPALVMAKGGVKSEPKTAENGDSSVGDQVTSNAEAPEATAPTPAGTAPTPDSAPTPQSCVVMASAERPVDVVFSLDISTTMGAVSKELVKNINLFAMSLKDKRVDVRLGGVAFVDKVEASFEPTDPETFRTKVASWYDYASKSYDPQLRKAHNLNHDYPEAGQAGIEKSLAVLRERGRPGAIKVIFHISDIAGFAGTNHFDFSTTQLGATMRAAVRFPGEVLFYTSVTNNLSVGKSGFALPQMVELRKNAGDMPGAELPWPVTADLLSKSLPEAISQHAETVCK
jgi:hypothetical protein